MQDQNKLAAAGRKPSGTPESSTFDSAAMERRVRQVKGGGIAPMVQAIASRNMKSGGSTSTNLAQHQNRSGLQAGVAAASGSAPPPPSNLILKCPRCSSLNTKFCYYNNYSLLQPRHFCKNCRRYWTKGGALRNVPVGGGCRKNKRATATTTTANESGTGGASLTATTTSALTSGAAKQGSMNMMIRENTAASCRNSSLATAPMITSAVQKAALQESMPPQIHTQFPPLYSYTSKNGQIQPAISLPNSAPGFYNATDHSNLAQYPLLNPRLAPFLPPNQAASFHSFLNLKQALSSLASPNYSFSFNTSLPPSSALPFLSNDQISTANLDAALQAPIDDPLMGLDPITASTTASLVPLPSLNTAHSTTTPSLFINNTTSSLALQQGFNHTNNHSNPAADHQLKSLVPISNDKNMNSLVRNDHQDAFGSSLSSGSACKGLQELHAVAMQQEMHARSSRGVQDMQHAAAIVDQEDQLNMQLMSRSSSMKDELVSDNFKMKGHDNGHDHGDNQPAAGALCCTNPGWGGHEAHRSSFLEASGDDQPYWSCNPSTWHDDLST